MLSCIQILRNIDKSCKLGKGISSSLQNDWNKSDLRWFELCSIDTTTFQVDRLRAWCKISNCIWYYETVHHKRSVGINWQKLAKPKENFNEEPEFPVIKSLHGNVKQTQQSICWGLTIFVSRWKASWNKRNDQYKFLKGYLWWANSLKCFV